MPTVIIDLNVWTTQAQLAKKLKVSRNVINNRVRRYIKAGTMPDYYIKELDIRLVPNVNKISDLGKTFKKQ